MDTIKGYFGLINKYYSELLAKEVILAYDGDVTHQVIKAFTQLVEEKLESENENETTRRCIHHVLVECLQNINRHAGVFYSDNKNYYPGKGALLISKSENYYQVITTNLILDQHVENLKKILEEINTLSDEELNKKYKQQLLKGKLSSKGGAGLGFIDIKRKTENKLEFNFYKNENGTSFFLFNALISR
jgi:hypothetical protein